MPIELIQDNRTTLRSIYQGRWTWDDFYHNMDEVMAYLEQTEAKIDMIIDLRASGSLPPGALSHLKNIKSMDHPQMGQTVIVGANTFMEVMGRMMERFRPQLAERQHFVATLEEAHERLMQVRERD